jgi:ATP-binding cassette subfamily C protein
MKLSASAPFLVVHSGEVSLFHRALTGAGPGPLHFLAAFSGPGLVPLHFAPQRDQLELRATAGAHFELAAEPAPIAGASVPELLMRAADQCFAGIESPLPAAGLRAVFPGEELLPPFPDGVFAGAEAVVVESGGAVTIHVLGQAAPGPDAPSVYLPKRAWALVAPTATPDGQRLIVRSCPELDQPAVIAATGHCVAQLIALGQARAAEAATRDHSGVAARQVAASRALQSGVGSLVSVLAARRDESASSHEDPLRAQLTLLWERQGIVARPTGNGAQGSTLERARVIAEQSGVRSRTVALKGTWWRDECGFLLGQTEDGDHPVALVPDRRGYRMRLAAGGWAVLDDATAATLGGFALTFYRALPAGEITAWGLVTHALSGQIGALARTLGLSLALAGLGLLSPLITSQLIDFAIPSAEGGLILVLTGGLALAALVATAFQLAQSLLLLGLESRVNQEMECAVWDRLLRLPAAFFKQYTMGDLAQRAASINRIRAALSGKILGGTLAGLFAVANFAVLFAFNATAAASALLLAVPVTAVLLGFTLVSTRWQHRLLASEAEVSSLTFELLSAVAKIRTTASEPFALQRWAAAYGVVRRQALGLQLLETGVGVAVGFYGQLAQAVLYAVAGALLLPAASGGGSTLTSGEFIGFMAAFAAFMQGLGAVARAIAELNAIKPMYDRVLPILHTAAESAGKHGTVPHLRGGIDIVSLSFGYSKEASVLQDLNLAIRPGEFVALVGASGSGKSTLLRLLLGFEQPDAGEIRYEGVSLADMDLRALRMRFGVVLQHGMLVPSDILSNIRGVTDATLEDCWAAAEAVALADEIRAMPMGMMTLVSEGASTISGGQRQRILLARALVKKPRIVFLDEATSALDNISQAVVTASLDRLAATRIVIAHRLSTIRHADRIVVLDAGRVVEEGRFEELMAKQGHFFRLSARQTATP